MPKKTSFGIYVLTSLAFSLKFHAQHSHCHLIHDQILSRIMMMRRNKVLACPHHCARIYLLHEQRSHNLITNLGFRCIVFPRMNAVL